MPASLIELERRRRLVSDQAAAALDLDELGDDAPPAAVQIGGDCRALRFETQP